MLSYLELELLVFERQACFLAAAEQARLEQSLPRSQPHPLLAWLGQQLVILGRQLQGERRAQETVSCAR